MDILIQNLKANYITVQLVYIYIQIMVDCFILLYIF